jgi:hypothetical protein
MVLHVTYGCSLCHMRLQVRSQMVLSTGMYAIAFASQLCDTTHIYGFGNGSCPHQARTPSVPTHYLVTTWSHHS